MASEVVQQTRRPGAVSQASSRPKTNPYAEWVTPDDLEELIREFYGTKILMVDKPLAEALLEHNTGNRRINRRKLEQIKSQMEDGQFENTGEPLIVSKEGILNNGQHRLYSIVETDTAVDMDVRFGIPRRMFSKTDTGTARTGGDIITIRGVKNGKHISQALRLLLLYERGLPDAIRDFVSNDEINSAFERWQDIQVIADRIFALKIPKQVRSTPLFATAYLATRASGKTKLEAWLTTLSEGLPDPRFGRSDPAYVLRERLMRGIDAAIGTREGQLERFALMIKSWNLYRKGETVGSKELRWRASGKAPEAFPSIADARLS